jgi:hypothetical protein
MAGKKKKMYPCVDAPCPSYMEVENELCEPCREYYEYQKTALETEQYLKEKQQKAVDGSEK